MPKKSYNIIFNSSQGTQLNSKNSSVQYQFDTNIIPHGNYLATFSFTSKVNNLTNPDLALIQISLGQNTTFLPTSSFGSPVSSIIGTIEPVVYQNPSSMTTSYNSNPPVYVYWTNPPSIIVNIYKQDLITYWTDTSSNDIGAYVLILNLEEMEE